MKLVYCMTADEPRDTGGVDVQDYQIQLDAGNGNDSILDSNTNAGLRVSLAHCIEGQYSLLCYYQFQLWLVLLRRWTYTQVNRGFGFESCCRVCRWQVSSVD